MDADVLIAGGGIAGLAAAVAVSRAPSAGNVRVCLLEQAAQWGEVGAGLQLGPNAVRVLADWGLMPELNACAAFPDALRVRDSRSGRLLGTLPLGARAVQRYGYPYATVHRADLHGLLRQAASHQAELLTGTTVQRWQPVDDGIEVLSPGGTQGRAHLLLGCDGIWSRVRQQLLGDGPPRPTGHLAYRGLLRQSELPAARRSSGVTAWLGPKHHVVHYPVRGGDWLNVVAVVHGEVPGDPQDWSHDTHGDALAARLGHVSPDLDEILAATPGWTYWPLHDRSPMNGPHQQAQGRIALLGDAAHPMRPYLAQGAAMALEDAWLLGRQLAHADWRAHTPELLQAWARQRWARNAWVQARSQRNGRVFHLQGVLRVARNLAMAWGGERLMDVPRLYAGPSG